MKRRDFLKMSAVGAGLGAGAALGLGSCRYGAILNLLLATANHHRFRIKAAFPEALDEVPTLTIDGTGVSATQTDSFGHTWTFDVDGLDPGTEYALDLSCSNGSAACDAWTLKTLPDPAAEPEHLRLLIYTCAGGPDDDTGVIYLPQATRRRLLARALSFEPDAIVAIGDHVYSDQRGPLAFFPQLIQLQSGGWFDRTKPIIGTDNERVLRNAFGQQIMDLYGIMARHIPVYFSLDDHDYTENDHADYKLQTFPPDDFMLDAVRVTQSFFYPEFLQDETLPSAHISDAGTSPHFGALRYGQLFEALLYDCRRFLDTGAPPITKDPGPDGTFIPADVEAWITDRVANSSARHVAQMPSVPTLWTAGKWAEWYPDHTQPGGALGVGTPKAYWSSGWLDQHDRLVAASAAHADRRGVFICGDLHATAAGQVTALGTNDISANPVASILAGAFGTGPFGFPSTIRGHVPEPSAALSADQWVRPIERNGFTILDVTPDSLSFQLYSWSQFQPGAQIETLEPFKTVELPRSPGAEAIITPA